MTTRDRLMLMGIVAFAVLLGGWFMAVAPEREKAAKVSAEVETAHQQLSTAESQADSATSARAEYSHAYASLVSLGQAVPASVETPALIYTLDRATHVSNVQFSSITNGAAGSSGASVSPLAPSAAFTQVPFTFVFSGTFTDLYKLLHELEGFTVQTPSGSLRVKGRLLTIDSVGLTPNATAAQGSSSSGKAGSAQSSAGELTGTITATAYVLPAGQAALGGATQSAPGGASTASTSRAPSGASTPGATAPAVVKATP